MFKAWQVMFLYTTDKMCQRWLLFSLLSWWCKLGTKLNETWLSSHHPNHFPNKVGKTHIKYQMGARTWQTCFHSCTFSRCVLDVSVGRGNQEETQWYRNGAACAFPTDPIFGERKLDLISRVAGYIFHVKACL